MAEYKGNEEFDSNDDTPPPLISHATKISCNNESDSEEEDQFEEMEDGSEEVWWKSDGTKKCKDLFSSKTFFNAHQCLDYCRNIHGFNLKILKKRHNMDCFSFFRLVNYLRSEKPSPGLVMSLSSDALWQDEMYLKPVEEDDPLLMVDIEEDVYDSIEDDEEEESFKQNKRISQTRNDRSPNGDISNIPESSNSSASNTMATAFEAADVTPEEYANLQQELIALRSTLDKKNAALENMLADMNNMKSVTRNLLLDTEPSKSLSSRDQHGNIKSVSENRTEREDSGYAGSYAHFGIHHEMLSDKIRTQSYKDAVSKNSSSLKDKFILDLGCGTGILSMFCAKLGNAEHVVGVDMSDIAHQAMDIVRENNLQDKITIIKGRLEDVDLRDKMKDTTMATHNSEGVLFDVLISEWMGYFLLFEGMLDSVMNARDRYLNQVHSDGERSKKLIMPNRCTMNLVGVCDEDRYNATAGYFEDVYGFKMSCLKQPMITEASIEVIPESKVVTSDAVIHELDMATCELQDTEFDTKFSFVAKSDCSLTAIGGYFDCFFEAPHIAEWQNVSFTTGPFGPATHWKQTLFYLEDKLPVQCDQKICGSIKVTRPSKDIRALKVTITLNGRRPQKFTVE